MTTNITNSSLSRRAQVLLHLLASRDKHNLRLPEMTLAELRQEATRQLAVAGDMIISVEQIVRPLEELRRAGLVTLHQSEPIRWGPFTLFKGTERYRLTPRGQQVHRLAAERARQDTSA